MQKVIFQLLLVVFFSLSSYAANPKCQFRLWDQSTVLNTLDAKLVETFIDYLEWKQIQFDPASLNAAGTIDSVVTPMGEFQQYKFKLSVKTLRGNVLTSMGMDDQGRRLPTNYVTTPLNVLYHPTYDQEGELEREYCVLAWGNLDYSNEEVRLMDIELPIYNEKTGHKIFDLFVKKSLTEEI